MQTNKHYTCNITLWVYVIDFSLNHSSNSTSGLIRMAAFIAFEDPLPMITFQKDAEEMVLSPKFPYELHSEKRINAKSACTSPFGFNCKRIFIREIAHSIFNE